MQLLFFHSNYITYLGAEMYPGSYWIRGQIAPIDRCHTHTHTYTHSHIQGQLSLWSTKSACFWICTCWIRFLVHGLNQQTDVSKVSQLVKQGRNPSIGSETGIHVRKSAVMKVPRIPCWTCQKKKKKNFLTAMFIVAEWSSRQSSQPWKASGQEEDVVY